MSNVLNIEFELVGKVNITFGVQNVFIKSLTKTEQKPESNASKAKDSNKDASGSLIE